MDEQRKAHRQFAVNLFNQVWDLLDKAHRTQEENDTMLHAAHASRYHWEKAGTALNLARGEWQVSRVYATLGRAEPALYHATRSLEICQANQIADFDLAFAHEALARARELGGDVTGRDRSLELAVVAGRDIEKKDDRKYFFSELKSIPGYEKFLPST
ncbi:MAG: hypothetical protein JSV61_15340 [Anaerolineales bacterium]|nr:MAG: hypothetical protein JSV61_15340 [Anaerolineales bacterium]